MARVVPQRAITAQWRLERSVAKTRLTGDPVQRSVREDISREWALFRLYFVGSWSLGFIGNPEAETVHPKRTLPDRGIFDKQTRRKSLAIATERGRR
ncbi:MAG TPA: hypothetical protein VGK64_16465 [Bryobacteraceae bacterium]